MSREKEWRKRLDEYDGDDGVVADTYRRYITKERQDEMTECLSEDKLIPQLVGRVFCGDESERIGTLVQEHVDDVIEYWLAQHQWWGAFTKWALAGIEETR